MTFQTVPTGYTNLFDLYYNGNQLILITFIINAGMLAQHDFTCTECHYVRVSSSVALQLKVTISDETCTNRAQRVARRAQDDFIYCIKDGGQ